MDDDETVDVLNLPQLYQRPSASTLRSVLDDLSLVPPSWSGISAPARQKIKSEGVPSYLTKIISSPLTWIEDDAEKEAIWETAAQRLSERSGRSGMGNISRVFSIPLKPESNLEDLAAPALKTKSSDDSTIEEDALEITLYEPALSEDNLGLKTWAASYLLAKRLPLLKATLPALTSDSASEVLELGSGTGLVGLAAAAVFQTSVLLTDLPAIVPNLERNVQTNVASINAHGGSLQTAVLDWTEPEQLICNDARTNAKAHSYQLILAADPIYSSDHPALLVNTISYHLSRNTEARVVIELPLREGYASERQDLRNRLIGLGLRVLEEGEEVGYDDWGAKSGKGGEEELAEVKCWWGVWGWTHA
ncbi:Protein-lysine N-methyltransferase rrg1 [Saxophila tyrrhenica]|uniref:Protein-lysine N-methyltransferase rrg1 n=1 Tax=Saxophila tyrrhenica TaxID=1690608 RepID=A0AAV9PBN1_9PEZI|nr:Protein-lysine N-methyltransferase rrg1 [Saxophila tyrrhenica]